MKSKILSNATTVASVLGVIASLLGTVVVLAMSLPLSEFFFSIFSTLVGLILGVYSAYLARFAKRLRIAPRVFISYSHLDQPAAVDVAAALRAKGARVWLDQERVKPGDSIQKAIERGIDDADTFVVLLSGHARQNLLLELGMARARGIRVIPVLLADAEVPTDLQGIRYIDLRDDRSRGLEELVHAAT